MVRILPLLFAAAALAGCAVPSGPTRATGAASCNRFASRTRLAENVPDCLLRDRTTLINGLPPAYPGNKS